VVAELLGWFGAGLSCVISLPQVVRTMRAKRLDGISRATYWLVLANAAAWTAWSLLTGEYAAGVPALINGPVAIVILHRLFATRQTARRSEFDTEVRKTLPIRPSNIAAAASSLRRRVHRWLDRRHPQALHPAAAASDCLRMAEAASGSSHPSCISA
jgi:uncharacterized protein with PQ loop repeat